MKSIGPIKPAANQWGRVFLLYK